MNHAVARIIGCKSPKMSILLRPYAVATPTMLAALRAIIEWCRPHWRRISSSVRALMGMRFTNICCSVKASPESVHASATALPSAPP